MDFAAWQELSGEARADRIHTEVEALPSASRRAAIAQLESSAAIACSIAEAKAGRLGGLPFFAKDLFDVAGFPTTASSRFLADEIGRPTVDSALVRCVKQAGAVYAGKTHLNEFAYGLSGENVHFGDVPHPMDPTRLSGGSSSGSAFAVARGIVPFALGTDTGGSIRVPAAFCGVWGIRYTPGFLTGGCFPLAPTFDCVGFFAQSAADLRRLHKVLPRSPDSDREDMLLVKPPLALMIEPETAVANHWRTNSLVERELLDWLPKLPEAFSVLQSREALEVHAHWIDCYKDQYDPATHARIERARHWTDKQVSTAEAVLYGFHGWIRAVFRNYPVLVMPAVPAPSPPKSQLNLEFREQLLRLTAPASLAGCPVLLEPVRVGDGSPLTVGWQYLCRDHTALNRAFASAEMR